MKAARTIFVLFVTAVLLGLTTCDIKRLDNPILIPLVDQEFELSLWETLDGQGGILDLQMKTLDVEDCENATIVSSFTKRPLSYEVTIFEILPPEECIPGEAPALGNESFGEVSNGIYALTIELNNLVTNLGNLYVTGDTYMVEMEDENGIGWTNLELRRVPAHALWGYVTYTDSQLTSEALAFINEIEGVSTANTLATGYYGHFELTVFGLTIKDAPENQIVRPFLLGFTGGPSEITQIVTDFRNTASPGIEVKVLDGEGNVW